MYNYHFNVESKQNKLIETEENGYQGRGWGGESGNMLFKGTNLKLVDK